MALGVGREKLTLSYRRLGSRYGLPASRVGAMGWAIGSRAGRLRRWEAIVGVLLACVFLTWWSGRLAPLSFAIPGVIGVAIAHWCRMRVGPVVAVFLVLAGLSAFGPVGLEFRGPGRPRIDVLPYSYGIRCVPGTVCRGCSVPRHPAEYAVVVSLPWSP